MGVDSLEQSQDDPDIHSQNVQVASECAPKNRATDRAEAEHHNFYGGSIFSGQTEGCTVLMVEFVDHLVQTRSVQSAVRPVVPSVFKNEEYCYLIGHGQERRERNAR